MPDNGPYRYRPDQSESVRAVAQVLHLMAAQEDELNDVGPWGSGYRQALADLRVNLLLRFGEVAFGEDSR